MEIEWPTLIEGGIPMLGGLYATALGYGVIRLSRMQPTPSQQKLLTRLRWLGPAVAVFGVFTGWQAHAHLVHPPAPELARQISSRMTFPVRVDSLTTLDSVRGSGDDLIYSYSISASLAELGGREQVQGKLEQQWLSLACGKPDVQKMLQAGYSLKMSYSFPATPDPVVIPVVARSCGK